MKSKKFVMVLASIVLLCIISMIGIWIQKYLNSKAAAVDGSGKIVIPTKDNAYEVGTAQNPFVILEIVPYEGYAEIGYLVDKQEPVNIDALSWDKDYYGNIGSTNAFTIIDRQNYQTFTPTDGMKNSSDCTKSSATQYGYYQKLDQPTGNYKQVIVREWWGGIKSVSYEKVESGGNYSWNGYEYGITHNKTPNHSADQVFTTKISDLYKDTGVTATNNNIFLKECLKVPDAQIPTYKLQVITVTSNQLNQNLGLIDCANLIYITDKTHNSQLTKIWAMERFRRTDMFSYKDVLSEGSNPRFYTQGYDLSWEAVVKILRKKLGSDLPVNVRQCPVIYDVCSLTDIGDKTEVEIKKKTKDKKEVSYKSDTSENNVYKLGLMLRQMPTEKLYNLYFKSNQMIKEGKKISDGTKTGEFFNLDGTSAGTYWNPFTLIPYHLVDLGENTGITNEMNAQLNTLGYPTNTGFDGTYNTIAGDELFLFNGDNSLEARFTEKSIQYNELTTKEAFDYYGYGTEVRLSPAEVIHYLLFNHGLGEDIEKLTILEIQPFDDFKTYDWWKNYIQDKLPGFRGVLTIKAMSSKEFICRIEELVGTYDLVYIGLNTALATAVEKYDLASADMAYSHVGQEIRVNQSASEMYKWMSNVTLSGIGDTRYFVTRFAGNDITLLKMNELLKYVETGYPILFGSDMLEGTHITSKLDTSSYVYSLVNKVTTDTKYSGRIMFEDTVTKEQFRNLIAKVVWNVNFLTLPLPYQDPITALEGGKTLNQQEIYINGSNNANRYLNYEFTISDDGSGSYYSASLFIDANADGIFRKTAGLDNEELRIGDVLDMDTNTIVDSNRLLAGHHYKIQKNISVYSGVITWKFSLERLKKNADDSYSLTGIKFNKTGISAIKKSTLESREEIKVLQITSDTYNGGSNVPSIYLPTDDEIERSGAENKRDADADTVARSFIGIIRDEKGNVIDPKLAKASGLFYYYIRNLVDYQISFERLSVKQYMESNIELDNYQMLIIGFADVCTDITSGTARDKINEFIDKGKTVLFTHDTTFYPSNHNTTITFRNRLGQDRFGTQMISKNVNIPINDLLKANKDIMYAPNTLASSALKKQSYGFTNQQIRRYTNTTYKINFDDLVTQKVSKINDGQITRYPYEIKEEITNDVKIAPTHYQYYQLDLEDKDVVVWYSLKKDGVYDKNDGRNAYYIYNKGNITYSGAGHYSRDFSTWEMPKQEVKLFVNTIIAAYRATPVPTEIEILNADKTTDRTNKDYLLIDYDAENATQAFGDGINNQKKRIYFKLNDKTTITYADLQIFYYTVNNSVSPEVLTPLSLQTTRKLNDSPVAFDQVGSSIEYYVDVKLDDLKDYNSMDLCIQLKLSYISDEGKRVELEPYKKYVQLLRRGLFNLD